MKTNLTLALLSAMLIASPAFAHGEKSPSTGEPVAHDNPGWSGDRSNDPNKMNKESGKYDAAYRYGADTYRKYPKKRYEDLNQAELRANWETARGNSNMTWDEASPTFRDAYNRAYNSKAKR